MEGTFYEPELQAVNVDSTTEYHIKVIKEACLQQVKRSPRALVALAPEIR